MSLHDFLFNRTLVHTYLPTDMLTLCVNVQCGHVASRFKVCARNLQAFVALQISINEIPWIHVEVELFTRPFLPLPFLTPPTRKGLGTKLIYSAPSKRAKLLKFVNYIVKPFYHSIYTYKRYKSSYNLHVNGLRCEFQLLYNLPQCRCDVTDNM